MQDRHSTESHSEATGFAPLDSWWTPAMRRKAGLVSVAELAQEARRNSGRSQLTWRDLRIAADTLGRRRGRAPRAATNKRSRGSRRCSPRSSSDESDPPDEPHLAAQYLTRLGRVNRALRDFLVAHEVVL